MAGADDESHAFVVVAYGDSPFLAGRLAGLKAQARPSPIAVATSTPSPFIEAAAATAGAPVLINPRSEGIAGDWNFALEATGARFVTLAHQDDAYAPGFTRASLLTQRRNACVRRRLAVLTRDSYQLNTALRGHGHAGPL